MKALILCGGKGTRLRPLTYTRSKPLLPIANKPIVEYALLHIVAAGISQVGIVINPTIENEFRTYFQHHDLVERGQLHITFIMQEKPLGLAHAVKVSREFLGEDSFLMYLGDNLLQEGVVSALKQFEEKAADALVMLKEVDDPSSFGIAIINEEGKVTKVIEKPRPAPSNLALVGVYVFSPRIHPAIDAITPSWRGELEITDAIQELINRGAPVSECRLNGWWLDTGKKDDILSANSIVLDAYAVLSVRGQVDKQSRIEGRVSIAENSQVINSTIRGPVIIGENVHIKNSFVGPYTSIGARSQISDSSIEHAIILNGVTVQSIYRLEDSIIGEETKVVKNEDQRNALRLMLGDNATVEI